MCETPGNIYFRSGWSVKQGREAKEILVSVAKKHFAY